MIMDVASVALPVGERLLVRKQRVEPEEPREGRKRVCIVTGIHGDELEGQAVAYRLLNEIRAHREYLDGIVDIYPALNPLGIDSIRRGIPLFDLDMNRIFPGDGAGTVAEYVAHEAVEDISGADLCIDIHASNIFLREIPQVRISESTAPFLVPLAKHINADFIWVHASATVLQSTLAHTMNSRGVPTLVVEMGVGMRVTREYCEQLTMGILNLMHEIGVWNGPTGPVREPIISEDDNVSFLNAEASGLFLPDVPFWSDVVAGQHIGDIVSPLTGEVLQRVEAEADGILFTLREYPMVYQGALLARILGGASLA
ncbi:MAG: M14 family metallopeptidase [Lachnospiraceae bacterium]|nr:M14 family metallopeptidase [Lachnospiraceae bacterium]